MTKHIESGEVGQGAAPSLQFQKCGDRPFPAPAPSPAVRLDRLIKFQNSNRFTISPFFATAGDLTTIAHSHIKISQAFRSLRKR